MREPLVAKGVPSGGLPAEVTSMRHGICAAAPIPLTTRLRPFVVVLVTVLALTGVGCSSSGGATSPSTGAGGSTGPATGGDNGNANGGGNSGDSDLSGTWKGTYGGTFSGTFTLDWKQTGSKLSGTIELSSGPGSLPINGRLEGDTITFGTVGSTAIQYSGSVSGSSMSGTYKVRSGGGARGDWSAHKVS
jgi:hypothetical protein